MTDGRPGPSTPAEVERQIDHTRAELARTLDALEQKLNARYFMGKGFEMFRDSLAGSQAINRSVAAIRANPIPLALIGIGTAWLIASNTGVVDRVARNERVDAARRRVADMASAVGTQTGAIASDVAGRIGMAGGSGGEGERALGHVGHPVVDEAGLQSGGWVHQAADRAQGALRSARDAGGAMLNRAGLYAGDGASRIADQVSDAFQRHPLVVGGIGLMAGILIAALVPLSRTEHELIGDTREELWHKAEQAGQQAVSRLREAAVRGATREADAATETGREEIREGMGKPSHR